MTELLPGWFPELLDESCRARLRRALDCREGKVRACAGSVTARLLALAELAAGRPRPLLLVVPGEQDARRITAQLGHLAAPGQEVLRLPRLDADPYRGLPGHPAVAATRVATLDRLVQGGPVVVVLDAAALLGRVPCRQTVEAWGEDFPLGGRVDLDTLARAVVAAGYRVVDVVTAPGDFARRGGLFDIWPPHENAPVRVELWGDEIDSLRRFDPVSQRTTGRLEAFRRLPAREAPIGAEQADALLDRLVGRARAVLAEAPPTEEGLGRLTEGTLAGLEGAAALYRDDLVPILDFVPSDLVVWEPEAVRECLERVWEEVHAAHQEADLEAIPPPEQLYVAPSQLDADLDAPLELAELPLARDAHRQVLDLGARRGRVLAGELDTLPGLVAELSGAGRPVVLVAQGPGRLQRLGEVLAGAGLAPRRADEDNDAAPTPGEVVLVAGRLDEGFEVHPGGAVVLAESDLFGPELQAPRVARRKSAGAFVSDLRDLSPGDLVVHVDHGVARYTGLQRRTPEGEELLALEYAGGDKLFVPVSRLDLIQKYSGGERALVPVDRLGGQGWQRRRRRVRREVERIAGELLELYARRQAIRAPSFADATAWQEEFEAAFPHALTDDQRHSLAEIKADLARPQPMDRLLCGDVGFGKTEVALRAAFQVVQEGWQVAVLVPTTVLAFQHLTTFRARMAGWPVRVEMVSRLVPTARVREILAETKAGRVDILVGTHRLLGKDVEFRKLGLLITDEEQRFGVKHKEAIKAMSLGVHALSMSATPIPRTLQMSLAGVRDLSVIETPPRNRLAIQTHLAPRSASLIAAAIGNELSRGGQVFFIHPEVRRLEAVAAEIRELVPGAEVCHAHGQMREGRLEEVMLRFIRGQAQVLVATSIVENGLDIPRANTILIDQAHRFGLSQLYQMRGRVGRSDQRAYAYLLVPSQRSLTSEARARLSALVEFSELGSGFRIAAMDLEIRGAGEFLGSRQSGHIAAVGFEMYNQMLEDEVRRLRGEVIEQPPEPVTINLGLAASLPETMIPDSGQRLAIYKRLGAAESEAEIEDLREETEDRYGRLPAEAETLFRIAELRLMAQRQGAVSIDWAGDGIVVRYGSRPRLDAERLVGLLREDEGVRMTAAGLVKLRVPGEVADRVAAARLALRRLDPR
ncbi:MAG: transcription-repair coupling factor [Acidobacteriota bacterium]|nr:transcription-repair coupling factor [Acidobacteriota bacterium]